MHRNVGLRLEPPSALWVFLLRRDVAYMAQAIEMARRSKLKRQRLFWFRRMETLSRPPKTMGLKYGERGEEMGDSDS